MFHRMVTKLQTIINCICCILVQSFWGEQKRQCHVRSSCDSLSIKAIQNGFFSFIVIDNILEQLTVRSTEVVHEFGNPFWRHELWARFFLCNTMFNDLTILYKSFSAYHRRLLSAENVWNKSIKDFYTTN